MVQCKISESATDLCYFNANGVIERDEDVIGRCAFGKRNERGQRLVKLARTHNLIIGNI